MSKCPTPTPRLVRGGPRLRRHIARLAWVLLVFVAGLVRPAAAQHMLTLGDGDADLDAWAVVTVLADADGRLSAADMLQRLDRFTPPSGPRGNLGVRSDAVWLRVPMTVPERADGRWLLDIDFPTLDDVRVHVVSDGHVVREVTLGDRLALADRPAAARTHVLPLALEPGVDHELLIRVQTRGSMIVPVRLMKAAAFHARESRVHLLQGIATGVALCLLMYALAQFASLRDRMFLYYAGTVAGTGLFFFAYQGLAALVLWPGQRWLSDAAPLLSLLLGLGSSLPLIERLLDVRALNAGLARAMHGTAWCALVIALLFAAGIVDYRVAHVSATLLGPLPVLLALPVAWVRWRAGDPAAPYLFAGWGVYGLGVAVMVALARGAVEPTAWTLHAFQAGSMFEMLMWLRVLGVRNEQAREHADRADREREVLRTLAHTDPLTGLPNRRGLEVELEMALPAAGPQRLLGVLLVDLDGFKAVNDRLGHDAGDDLLVAVAARLRGELRHRDIVGRLGGDEFVVLARELASEHDAWRLGRKLVAAFDAPFDLRGVPCRVGLTVGFALAPLDAHDARALLRRADAAMYAGKQAGKGTVRRDAASGPAQLAG